MKQIFKTIAIIIALCVLAVACVEDNEFILPEDPNTEKPEGGNEDNKENGEDDGKEDGKDDGGKDEPTPEPPIYNDYPDTAWAAGELDWVFDMNALPEIRISVTEEQWNELLKEYDRDSHTAEYIHCDAEFKSKGETHNFVDAGLRLRGNTSRRRPEGNGGEMHKRDNADWHHCHFMLNLRKYQKDDAHELHNVRKLH
ncbi:MAG: hypothetical protein IIV52_03010, partial [Alistipes sp.]|nr:hypothetical protein [Alistipes sp.]